MKRHVLQEFKTYNMLGSVHIHLYSYTDMKVQKVYLLQPIPNLGESHPSACTGTPIDITSKRQSHLGALALRTRGGKLKSSLNFSDGNSPYPHVCLSSNSEVHLASTYLSLSLTWRVLACFDVTDSSNVSKCGTGGYHCHTTFMIRECIHITTPEV